MTENSMREITVGDPRVGRGTLPCILEKSDEARAATEI
jgi:hypothetical protein